MKVIRTKRFMRHLKSLPPDRQKRAFNALKKFAEDRATPSLRFRQLASNPGQFIINCTRGDRIVLTRVSDLEYVAEDVGPHDNVLRRQNR